jgi:PAS domain S-box-containing protein
MQKPIMIFLDGDKLKYKLNIITPLEEEEKLGKLQNQIHNNQEKLQILKKSYNEKTNYNNSQKKTNHIELHTLQGIYQTVFENSAVAIMLTNEKEQIFSWNKYAEDLLGMTKDDLYLKNVKTLYPPEEWIKIRSQNIRQKGMQHHLETKILRKNNEQLDVDISLSILKDPEGIIIGSIGVLKDISKQKQTEQRLKSLMENASDSIYLIDNECRYLLVNNEILSRLGLPLNQVIGKTFSEFHSPEETKEYTKKINLVFKNGEPIKDQHKSERLDRWFLRTLSPVKDDITNEITAVAVISKDITDWKKTEEKLKASEERYRTIFDNSAIAIMFTDENEKIISWNKYTEILLGMKKDDLYMKPVAFLYPSDEWQKIRSQNVRQKGMQHRLETKMLTKNNELLDVDISLSVLKNHEGKIVGSIGVIKDISERKQAEKELKILNEELEKKVDERTADITELLKQKDEFISWLGHDLKTPLSILKNILPIIKENSEKSDVKEDCDVAIRNVNYIENLVVGTLKIAELNSPKVQFKMENIILSDIVENTIEDNQFICEEKNIKIENMVDDKIIVEADKLKLGELFNNLISNAVKYISNGGSNIIIDAYKDKDFVTITVKDEGIGMTKNQLEHIFDEFYKTDDSRHSLESSGLGLSICKRIVEKHGGRIWAESPGVGKGTTFNFTLKVSKKEGI